MDIWNEQRQKIAAYYYQHLGQISGITPPQELLGG
ncbi:Pleiotropic regulatory protein [degT] protein [Cylindrospermopsis raciborskii CS-505]|nr:Pleiotropic regulatory protein [degT] protein [Cylindrospermopsis raciborskii CS-505]